MSCQYYNPPVNYWQQRLWYSDDRGRSWHGPVSVAEQRGLHLCEASILRLPDATLVAFLRENSGQGHDCYKAILPRRRRALGGALPVSPCPAATGRSPGCCSSDG